MELGFPNKVLKYTSVQRCCLTELCGTHMNHSRSRVEKSASITEEQPITLRKKKMVLLKLDLLYVPWSLQWSQSKNKGASGNGKDERQNLTLFGCPSRRMGKKLAPGGFGEQKECYPCGGSTKWWLLHWWVGLNRKFIFGNGRPKQN